MRLPQMVPERRKWGGPERGGGRIPLRGATLP
jgi:hypothetical protein